jgi:NAD(P)-dependent dehydrogenase (short-subunit alcohol dehydrogenase family)
MGTYDHSNRGAGKVALVTGGGSGIGAEIGRWLAAQAVDVVLGDVDEFQARTVAREITADDHGRALDVHLDVTDEASVEAVVDTVEAEFGRLDYLFANAGLAGPVELDETTYEAWRSVIDVNVNGAFLTVLKAIPLLTANESDEEASHVVVTSSISGRKPKPIMIPYRTSKAATIMLTRCLATALGPAVKVNALCPGRIDTPLAAELYERRADTRGVSVEQLLEAEQAELPLGRTPDHEDVHQLLEYLLFRDAFVTGHEFHLDGGGYQSL